MQPLLDKFQTNYPDMSLVLRGDSGFATPGLYLQCETNGTSYVIRLKENNILRNLAHEVSDDIMESTKQNRVDYAVQYGEFMYQAKSWNQPRRVVGKVEKPQYRFDFKYTFIITNMDSSPENLIKLYSKRGTMENYIKKSKNGSDFNTLSSSSRIVNANRLQIHALAYNIFNWFKHLSLPEKMKKQTIDTIRLKLLKIATRVVRSARYTYFRLCSSCPYKAEFREVVDKIQKIQL